MFGLKIIILSINTKKIDHIPQSLFARLTKSNLFFNLIWLNVIILNVFHSLLYFVYKYIVPCQHLNWFDCYSSLVSGRQEKLSPSDGDESGEDTNRVKQVPFVFSIIELLPMCQQIETLFPTYCTTGVAGKTFGLVWFDIGFVSLPSS